MEKMAVSVAIQCRTQRTSLPWPLEIYVCNGPFTVLLWNSVVVGPQELQGFGRASSCCFKINAAGSQLGWAGEASEHFGAISQKHPHVTVGISCGCSFMRLHIRGAEVQDINNRIFLLL